MLFKATSPAASSRSPCARSFHTSTMAMHGARAMSITPEKYSGSALWKIRPSTNINVGPTIQLMKRPVPSTRGCLRTLGNLA